MSLKLNLGCGKDIKEGWLNVDIMQFDGVDAVLNVGQDNWPWEDGSVEEVHASHLIEHLMPLERIHFVNELHRVMSPTGKAALIAPHWASCRAYGDLTHQWPPVSEFWCYYLAKDWREVNAPHNDLYTCDFTAVWGYGVNQAIQTRNPEFQQFAMANYKEAITDIFINLTKKA